MIPRRRHLAALSQRLRRYPVVAILGARQVGKTTLAGMLAEEHGGPVKRFDLEDPRDLAQLEDPMLALEPLDGLVILDEIHHRPDLFPILRVLADRRPVRTRFLILGSASPELLRQGAESLAGRISYHRLPGLDLREVGADSLEKRWLRGGFPPSYLAPTDRESLEWRRDFIQSFLQRDLPSLGLDLPPAQLYRFWAMLAHYHGQLWNASKLGRAFGVADTTVRRYLDLLTGTFVVRQLPAFRENIRKRQVKAPKVYITDSGLLHALLELRTRGQLERHPKVGASWEGFLLETVVQQLAARPEECFFWGVHSGPELDLLVIQEDQRLGFELKRTTTPKLTTSMRTALEELELSRLVVVHAGNESFDLSPQVRAVAARHLLEELQPVVEKQRPASTARPATAAFFAHSAPERRHWEPLREHLTRVATLAAQFATPFGAAEQARLAGLLHDLGKYSERFTARLEGRESGLDHWSIGAWAALTRYKQQGVAPALAVQGHHIGLQQADNASLRLLAPQALERNHPLDLRLTEADPDLLLQRLEADGLELPELDAPFAPLTEPKLETMLDVRMLFSALVDADFLATEGHFQGAGRGEYRPRPVGLPLRPEEALAVLDRHLTELAERSAAAEHVVALRQELLAACREKAEEAPGLFTLTAPTGSGKTLAMLAFALQHAARHQLRRVVLAIPYLSIVDQTARVYRELLAPVFGEGYVLEHHSLAELDAPPVGGERDHEAEARLWGRQLAENWDAPLVVTTNVQLLESLFANRPSRCRKLHRLADSVILFDEAQALPPALAVPTLATLSHLAARYGSSVVFATATQPAFDHLHPEVSERGSGGWQPAEIVPRPATLFDRARRTEVRWETEERTTWSELAARLAEHEQVLAIVNLKRHAQALAGELEALGGDSGLLHLSTNLCPAHREVVLDEVRRRLEVGEPCRLVATQCVEAGVDLDFPAAFRALGPLEAIAQAAGRCNRGGTRPEKGPVVVFLPPAEAGKPDYPPGVYKQASEVTLALLRKAGGELDIDSPEAFRAYFRSLYDLTGVAEQWEELEEAVIRRDFQQVAGLYHLIDRPAIEVLVPYDEIAFSQLEADLDQAGRLTREWIRRARPHAVSLYEPGAHAPYLEPAPLGRGANSDDWFLYLRAEDYDRDLLGLQAPPDVWIG